MSVPRKNPKPYPLMGKKKPPSVGDARRAKNRAARYRAEDKATNDINRRLRQKK